MSENMSVDEVVGRLVEHYHEHHPSVSDRMLTRTEASYRGMVQDVFDAGLVVMDPKAESDHYVTIHKHGWFIEHSLACRLAGTLGTCEFNRAIAYVEDDFTPDDMGRWRITQVDAEGVPSLERAPVGRGE